MQNWGPSDKKKVANEGKNGKSTLQSYISSQQQGHHTALPDNSQLFLKQFLHLRSRAGLRDPSWKMSSLSPFHSIQTQGMPEGLSHPSPAGTSVIPIPARAQPDSARCLNHSPERRLEMALWGTIFSILTQLLTEIRFLKRFLVFFPFKRCKLVGKWRLRLCLPFHRSLLRLDLSVLSAHYLSD